MGVYGSERGQVNSAPRSALSNECRTNLTEFRTVWMDGVARLEDGCPQVPGTACYQDKVLFIVMLQGSAATALSPSDLSIIQPAHECTASGLQV